jgi:hypothetical protein
MRGSDAPQLHAAMDERDLQAMSKDDAARISKKRLQFLLARAG